MNHIKAIDLWKAYGEPGEKGVPAHTFMLTRTQPANLPTATAVLIEKEWARIKRNFTGDKQVPFFRGFTENGICVHEGPFRFAAVFNRNPLRLPTIEPLYESHKFAQLGELLLPLTSDGTLVFAKKVNQASQFSGFGGHINMDLHHQKEFDIRTGMQDILERELNSLAQLVNTRVVGILFVDHALLRGVDIALTADSRFSEQEWLTQFPQTDQFSRELVFVEPTAAALLATVTEYHQKNETFSPSAIAACYFMLRAHRSDAEAESFRDGIRALGYPLAWDDKPKYLSR